jgi:hypothetical protein
MAPGQKEITHRTKAGYIVAWDSTEDSEQRRAIAKLLREAEDAQIELLYDELFPSASK